MFISNAFKMTLFRRHNITRLLQIRLCSSKKTKPKPIDDEEVLGPISFTNSPASKWKAETSRSGVKSHRLWYEPYVIITSLVIFMLYFCVYREENDIDEELQVSLYSRIKGLEEHQLKLSLDYNEKHGLETKAIEVRLRELEQIRKERAAQQRDS